MKTKIMDTTNINDSIKGDSGVLEALLDTAIVDSIKVAENSSESVLGYLFAGVAPSYFIAAMITALIGISIRKLIHLSKRDKKSERSPEKFNIGFWIKDNISGIALNVLLLYVLIIFTADILLSLFGIDVTSYKFVNPMYIYLVVGLGLQQIIDKFQDKTHIGKVK